MRNQYDDGYLEWQPGTWVECEATQERGQIKPHEGKRVRVDLGHGVKLFGSPEVLKHLGWEPVYERPRETSSDRYSGSRLSKVHSG
jgi:hypothetical protein